MPLFTMITGAVLILVGALGYYFYTTITVLIPAILGLIIFLLGILSKKEIRRRKCIHTAIMVVVLGLAASWSGIKDLPLLLSCSEIITCNTVVRPVAILFKSIMFIALLPYLIVSIQFFIKARMTDR